MPIGSHRALRASRALSLGSLLLVFASGCAREARVARVTDGQLTLGRFIDERAYALYARGRLLELEGAHQAALEVYERATSFDPESVELWVRILATRCALGSEQAAAAFDAARSRDARFAPLWLEASRCSALPGIPEPLSSAQEAVAAAPDWDEASARVAELLAARGRKPEADAWALAFRLRSTAAPRPQDPIPERDAGALLVSGERAAALEQARARFAANPRDTQAWLVLLLLASLDGDEEGFDKLLRQAERTALPLDASARELLRQLLYARAGELFSGAAP